MRVVVLHHTGIESPHFDLMIEPKAGDALWTWRVAQWPPVPDQVATRLADHRNEYLRFEGEVCGNRGRVRRVFASMCGIVATNDTITVTAGADCDPPTAAAPFAQLRLIRQSDSDWTLRSLPVD